MELGEHLRDQTIAGFTNFVNNSRIESLKNELGKISSQTNFDLNKQNNSFSEALKCINKVRDFLGSPENILGSESTKHGEIAEQVDVNIRNAQSFLEHNKPTATFENVGRTAPEDYLIDGIQIQSKFINGLNNNLDHVLDHMNKYDYFGRDKSHYIIPKDNLAKITEILKGNNPDNLSKRTIDKIIEKVHNIELKTGKSFNDVIKPSISNYNEVQQGVVFKTLDGHEETLTTRNNEIKDAINNNSEKEKINANNNHAPSLNEALKVGILGGIVGGGFSAVSCLIKKNKEGKKITEFNSNDWKDVGVDFSKGGIRGSISGFSIYGLTNFSNMPAPVAGAFVTTAIGIGNLFYSYQKGDISQEELFEQGQVLCIETSFVALGATIGQAAIPIPVIGALIGTLASKFLFSQIQIYSNKESEEIRQRLEKEYEKAMDNIGIAYREVIRQILFEYERLGTITSMAFDFERNVSLRLQKSIDLAIEYGVDNKKILKTLQDADNFFLS